MRFYELKTGVSLEGVQEPMLGALNTIGEAFYEQDGQACIITSTTEGKHKTGSMHYLGLAVDLRRYHLNPRQVSLIYVKLQRVLNEYILTEGLHGKFDVVLEQTHFHIEFDRRLNK